ncbi:MAG: LD-carboxypeptidase [Candidatus Cloacimonetes bacterium]|nr:LD-carboxypeptidase [Candidatus Cloacimonadota bacterium]
MIKAKQLKPGDSVAIVSPSWGGPSQFPHIFKLGLKVLRDMGLKVREFPSATKSEEFLSKNPKFRAQDINNAFLDSSIKAIFASIGGDDSIRLLPFLDKKIILDNPKILIGYSDTTSLLAYLNQLGLITFHGPSVMAGFSQLNFFEESFKDHIQSLLFTNQTSYEYKAYQKYHEGYLTWVDETNIGVNPAIINEGWTWLQGGSICRGKLFGGCFSVLEMMKSTPFWPSSHFWKNRILFLETSEMKPSPDQIKMILRNYGMQGVFSQISALLIGRPIAYSTSEKHALNRYCLQVVRDEFGCKNLAIVTNMDFGHTDPQWILPLGVEAEIDCTKQSFKLVESVYSD